MGRPLRIVGQFKNGGRHVTRWLLCLLLLSIFQLPGSAQAKLTTPQPQYPYSANITYVGEGLPPQTMIFIYTSFYEEGQPEIPADQMSLRYTITTGPRGIIEGEIDAPPSGNTGARGTFVIELRPNNERTGGTSLKLPIVP